MQRLLPRTSSERLTQTKTEQLISGATARFLKLIESIFCAESSCWPSMWPLRDLLRINSVWHSACNSISWHSNITTKPPPSPDICKRALKKNVWLRWLSWFLERLGMTWMAMVPSSEQKWNGYCYHLNRPSKANVPITTMWVYKWN